MKQNQGLFRTNCNALNKILNQLQLRQTMTYRQVILNGSENIQNLNEAEKLISKAIWLLRAIK